MDKSGIVRILLGIIAVGCIGYFAYYWYQSGENSRSAKSLSNLTTQSAEGEVTWRTIFEGEAPRTTIRASELEPQILPKYETLYEKNKNLIGWIKIADTDIDYPVVKSVNGDGSFYLNHDFDGNEDRNGTLFMDDACDPLLPSDNLIIYGHNMKSGKMFGELDQYKSESFYKKHKQLHFDTIYRTGTFEVVFAFQSRIYSEADITFKYYQFITPNSQEEFDSGIRQMREMSLYDTGVDVEYGDELLTLSTCDYDESDGRFVVVCRRVV